MILRCQRIMGRGRVEVGFRPDFYIVSVLVLMTLVNGLVTLVKKLVTLVKVLVTLFTFRINSHLPAPERWAPLTSCPREIAQVTSCPTASGPTTSGPTDLLPQ